jgi:hypothetical protein
MKKEDVLLTEKEKTTIYNLLASQGGTHTNKDLINACAKFAQIKLLEYGRQRCPHTMRIGDMGYYQRFSCPKCIFEIESILNG